MYGDPTTTPGGKALKFYCSVRVQIARVGGSQVKVKVGGEEQTVGHTIRATIKKNKVAAPFRKAEFPIFYDGRKQEPSDEIAAAAMLKGLIPKYDSQGNISATARTYKFKVEDEELIAKKKDDVAIELRKYPKVQAALLEMIKNGAEPEQIHEQDDFDSDMSEDEFEEMIRKEAKELTNGSEAEEISEAGDWDKI